MISGRKNTAFFPVLYRKYKESLFLIILLNFSYSKTQNMTS